MDVEQVVEILENLHIELSSQKWEESIPDLYGNAGVTRELGNIITVKLRFGKYGKVISEDSIKVENTHV